MTDSTQGPTVEGADQIAAAVGGDVDPSVQITLQLSDVRRLLEGLPNPPPSVRVGIAVGDALRKQVEAFDQKANAALAAAQAAAAAAATVPGGVIPTDGPPINLVPSTDPPVVA